VAVEKALAHLAGKVVVAEAVEIIMAVVVLVTHQAHLQVKVITAVAVLALELVMVVVVEVAHQQ
jgi:hypothetical protein